MPTETERKFLLKNDSWRKAAVSCTLIRQAYAHFQKNSRMTLRIRMTDDDQAYLTLKGPVSGCSRPDFEYPVPFREAQEILKVFCESGRVEKYRYQVPFGSHVWEVDEFLGDNAGLIMAEIELSSPNEEFERPGWLGREVTGEVRFYNSHLLEYPFRDWKEKERQ